MTVALNWIILILCWITYTNLAAHGLILFAVVAFIFSIWWFMRIT